MQQMSQLEDPPGAFQPSAKTILDAVRFVSLSALARWCIKSVIYQGGCNLFNSACVILNLSALLCIVLLFTNRRARPNPSYPPDTQPVNIHMPPQPKRVCLCTPICVMQLAVGATRGREDGYSRNVHLFSAVIHNDEWI